jgi:hypothetical protein
MAGMADGMVEWQKWLHTYYLCGQKVKMVGMVEWREWRTEWSNGRNGGRNGRMAEIATYVLFMVHTDTDDDDEDDDDNDDDDDDDTLIFFSIDHNMVFSYNHGKQKRGGKKTNAPPLLAVSMATAVRRSNTDGIDQCSMSRATREATGCRNWTTTRSVLLQQPLGQCTNFTGHFDGRSGVQV